MEQVFREGKQARARHHNAEELPQPKVKAARTA